MGKVGCVTEMAESWIVGLLCFSFNTNEEMRVVKCSSTHAPTMAALGDINSYVADTEELAFLKTQWNAKSQCILVGPGTADAPYSFLVDYWPQIYRGS